GAECGADQVCLSGICVAADCTSDADCSDGNVCNGVEVCDLATFTCQAGTPPGNGAACGSPGQVCLGTSCITPQCTSDADCSDGNACNGAEVCNLATFTCQAGTPPGNGAACGSPGQVCVGTSCITPECTTNGDCSDGNE